MLACAGTLIAHVLQQHANQVEALLGMWLKQRCMRRFLQDLNWSPETILDAGANAGYASVVLSQLFPKAKIIALEPDPANFEMVRGHMPRSFAKVAKHKHLIAGGCERAMLPATHNIIADSGMM